MVKEIKASELVKQLVSLTEKYGDLDVMLHSFKSGGVLLLINSNTCVILDSELHIMTEWHNPRIRLSEEYSLTEQNNSIKGG